MFKADSICRGEDERNDKLSGALKTRRTCATDIMARMRNSSCRVSWPGSALLHRLQMKPSTSRGRLLRRRIEYTISVLMTPSDLAEKKDKYLICVCSFVVLLLQSFVF